MSYILDALSKADARRAHAAPDLHSRSGLTDVERSRRSAEWHPAWLWLVAAVLVMGSIAALWLMLRKTSPTPTPTPPPAVAQAPLPAAKPAPVQTPAPAPPPTAHVVTMPTAPSPSASAPKITVSPSSPAGLKADTKPAVPPTTAQPAPPLAKAATPKATVKSPAPAAQATGAQSVASSSARADPTPAPAPDYATLSPAVKSQMPALSVGGSVYSPQPSARMVVLNGQVLREGDKVSEGLTLESIGPKSSTLSWQGNRFQLPH